MRVAAFISLLVWAGFVAGQAMTINTPTGVVHCLRQVISWSGGTAPYVLTVQPGNDVSAPALENLGEQTGTSFSWFVQVAPNTSVFLRLRDSTGLTAETAPFTIQAGSSPTCTPPSDTPSQTTGTATTTGGASTPATTPGPSPTTPAPTGATTPRPSGTATSTPAATTGAALQIQAGAYAVPAVAAFAALVLA